MRSLDAKVLAARERLGPAWHVEGLFVLRATRRNRRLLAEFRSLFAAHYPASSGQWLRALGRADVPLPNAAGFAWSASDAGRLFPARRR